MEQYYFIVACLLSNVLGLCVGSFLNVVIYRLPLKMSLSKPSSHCTTCDYVLRWYDNIPVISYIMLGGKCRSCKERISPRYMLVELANGILWLLCVILFWKQSPVYAVLTALAITVMICIFFIDLEHLIIFNRFSIALALLGVGCIFTDPYTVWYDHLIGALAGALLFLLIYFGAILVLKKEGMGFGDVKLAAAGGLLLGWQRFIFAIIVASVTASIVLLIIRIKNKHEKGREYPFGPFIVLGITLSLFVGAPIMDWYIGLLLG